MVFLPGEREIRDCAEAIRKDPVLNQRFHLEALNLFTRQSVGEQERVFQSGSSRRIVLATNAAETSSTVPGIRFVIDVGVARVKRYSYRNKVEHPMGRVISDGIQQLIEELGAMESEGPRQGALTPIGKQLAALPLDPRVGRILLAAKEQQALREVLIIATTMAM